MTPLQHTQVRESDKRLHFSNCALVLALLPHMTWRRHGIGALQGYVHEAEEQELRVHIWHDSLCLPGIHLSGSVHDHRFNMLSHVLAGVLYHVEHQLVAGEGWELYDFVSARQHTSKESKLEMRRLEGAHGVVRAATPVHAGQSYTFARGAFHETLPPLNGVTVTLVHKLDQVRARARVLAPVGTDPVPAFSGPDLEGWQVDNVVSWAALALREELKRAW